MSIVRNLVDRSRFNRQAELPYELRLQDFEIAMQDVYDFFHDVNVGLVQKGLERLDDMLRPAIMSGLLSDMLSATKAGTDGVEIKTTRNRSGAVDTHGAPDQWMCVFVYQVDDGTEPAVDRMPMTFTEVYLGKVTREDFRRNPRGELGTRTATLHREGMANCERTGFIRSTSS